MIPAHDPDIVKVVVKAMTRYVGGSFRGGPGERVIWHIHDSWDVDRIVAVFHSPREVRDARLLELNAIGAIAAYGAALAERGWAIVPREPTQEMKEAGNETGYECVVSLSELGEGIDIFDMAPAYRAMIAAAPK